MTDTTRIVSEPNYDQAIEHALRRLQSESPPNLHYHCAWHTEGDVLPAVRRLAQLAGVAPHEQRLLEIGAAYHDIGHLRSSQDHEAISIEIMTDALPRFGFSPADIERVAGLILATRMPQSPKNELEKLLADADLDVLGRSDFLDTSKALWRELTALGRNQNWTEWMESQLRFLRSHSYFTGTAKTLREQGKQQNIALLEKLIQQAHVKSTE